MQAFRSCDVIANMITKYHSRRTIQQFFLNISLCRLTNAVRGHRLRSTFLIVFDDIIDIEYRFFFKFSTMIGRNMILPYRA